MFALLSIAVMLVVVLLILFWIYNTIREKENAKCVGPVTNLQCGDVVLFSLKGWHASAFVFQDIYFHVGIMISKDRLMHYVNPLHIDEFKGQVVVKGSGLIVSNILDVFDVYPRGSHVKVLRGNFHQCNSLLEAGSEVASGTTYDFHYIMSWILNDNDPKLLNCTTFLGKLLEKLGILNNGGGVRDYVPGNFATLLQKAGWTSTVYHQDNP